MLLDKNGCDKLRAFNTAKSWDEVTKATAVDMFSSMCFQRGGQKLIMAKSKWNWKTTMLKYYEKR